MTGLVFDPDEEERYHDDIVARGLAVPGGPRTRWTATDLMAEDFPEPRWAVPGVIPEGLTLLAGSPKVGKSWAALGLAVAVASGGDALGRIPVARGDVLYLALEDVARRLQRRMGMILEGASPPEGLSLWTDCDRFPDGAAAVEGWLDEHPDARLVVIDVFARIRPPADPKQTTYDGDYAATRELKRLADDRGVPVVLVHHTRKATSEDWLDTISGTQGLAGGCDGVLVLRRQRGAASAELLVTGRDVEETRLALEFAPETGAWRLLDGPAEEYALGDTRRAVMQLLRDHDGLTPKAVADHLDITHDNAKKTLNRMFNDEQVDSDGNGRYFLPESGVPPVSAVPPDLRLDVVGDSGDTGDTARHHGDREEATR